MQHRSLFCNRETGGWKSGRRLFDGSPILDCLRLAICLELYDICFDTNHCGGIGYIARVYTAMVVPFAGQEIKLQLDLFRSENCRFFEYMAERGYRFYLFLRALPDISLLIEFDRSNFFPLFPFYHRHFRKCASWNTSDETVRVSLDLQMIKFSFCFFFGKRLSKLIENFIRASRIEAGLIAAGNLQSVWSAVF